MNDAVTPVEADQRRAPGEKETLLALEEGPRPA
jgi:hypothetical protein